jgi:tetraacyldisaccharide 4'-kinase
MPKHYLLPITLPLSLLWAGVLHLRHWLYDKAWLKQEVLKQVPTICVGNLSFGGTGKTPMVEYLVRLLQPQYNHIGVLSRGYRRKTRGFVLANNQTAVTDIGDEPFQFKRKFAEVMVAVCEDRAAGVKAMLAQQSPPQVIILDDAYQHRAVKAQKNILLTTYQHPFSTDNLFPMGQLRDVKSRAQVADIVVVTKCPATLSEKDKDQMKAQLGHYYKGTIVFATIAYDKKVYANESSTPLIAYAKEPFTLVTGIANPVPLIAYLQAQGAVFQHLSFPDHHHFSADEIERLKRAGRILTTEKDYVRLEGTLPNLHYLPIAMQFLSKEDEQLFGTLFGM